MSLPYFSLSKQYILATFSVQSILKKGYFSSVGLRVHVRSSAQNGVQDPAVSPLLTLSFFPSLGMPSHIPKALTATQNSHLAPGGVQGVTGARLVPALTQCRMSQVYP